MSINKVILIGNLGRDPEIKAIPNGGEVASFSLATTDYWKDKQTGERRDKTEWHQVVVFAPGLVNLVKNCVKKGAKIYIEGSLQTRKWVDKNNIERHTTEIVLQGFNSTLQLLGDSDNAKSQPAPSQQPIQTQQVSQVDYNDDVTF